MGDTIGVFAAVLDPNTLPEESDATHRAVGQAGGLSFPSASSPFTLTLPLAILSTKL